MVGGRVFHPSTKKWWEAIEIGKGSSVMGSKIERNKGEDSGMEQGGVLECGRVHKSRV